MKKVKNKLFIMLLIVLTVAVIFIALIYMKVIPNPFLNRNDLYCHNEGFQFEDFVSKNYNVISFDIWGEMENGTREEHFIYEEEEVVKSVYKKLQEQLNDYNSEEVKLQGNTIIVVSELEISLDIKDKTRKELIKIYEELNYVCE